MNNGQPLPARKRIQLLLGITFLAWATQTLMAQWSRGAETDAPHDVTEVRSTADAAALNDDAGHRSFVPSGALASATLELRAEAKVFGAEVKLKQVCRWASADAATLAPVADLVIAKLDARRPFHVFEIKEIRETLGEAGINVALIRFAGPVECTVSRSDVSLGEGEALDQWIRAHGGEAAVAEDETVEAEQQQTPRAAKPKARPLAQPAAMRQRAWKVDDTETNASADSGADTDADSNAYNDADAAPEATSAVVDDEDGPRTLKSLLAADASVRLDVPVGQLQITFNPQDEAALALAEPSFKFDVQPRRVRDLGDVSWDVTIVSGSGSRKLQVRATARAWMNQVVVSRSLTRGQVIQKADVTARRALVDKLPGETLLATGQVVGHIASRDLKPGTMVTAPLVEAVPLAKSGQFITVTLNRGSVRIKSVGKALEGGSYGETIRVKNEATKDVYQVILTGPQEGSIAAPPAPAADKGVALLGRD